MSRGLFRLDETRQWLQIAAEDLKSAEVLLQARPPLLKQALFSCQQTVEKALKAFLVFNERPFGKIHDLDALGKLCFAIDPSLAPVVQPARWLTKYAVEFRYPGELEQPTVEESLKWLAVARTVLAEVAQRLPQEPQSSVGSETES
jgi:HEPN domain-containing protein